MERILVTGAAGFIGFHTARRLLERGVSVFGLDNLNDYYDPQLKRDRLALLCEASSFQFHHADLADNTAIQKVFQEVRPTKVINLAAQAGVRHSLDHPHVYIETNVAGFLNILEGCRHGEVEHLVYASSGSVYGSNTHMPFSVHDNVDHPLSLYGASKKANELMAHSYSHLYRLPVTGLRFFSVYGPWGRPDMAAYIFTRKILAGETIDVYNEGKMRRDFTYVDDIVTGILRVSDNHPAPNPAFDKANPDPGTSDCPYLIYNIGNDAPVDLMYMIQILEDCLGKKASMRMLPMQAGDIPASWANVDDLARDVDFRPSTPIETGLANFVSWFREYHRI